MSIHCRRDGAEWAIIRQKLSISCWKRLSRASRFFEIQSRNDSKRAGKRRRIDTGNCGVLDLNEPWPRGSRRANTSKQNSIYNVHMQAGIEAIPVTKIAL